MVSGGRVRRGAYRPDKKRESLGMACVAQKLSRDDDGDVTPENLEFDRCARCGREIRGEGYCRLMRDGKALVLCSPACAERFIWNGAGGAGSPDGLRSPSVEELVEALRWRTWSN